MYWLNMNWWDDVSKVHASLTYASMIMTMTACSVCADFPPQTTNLRIFFTQSCVMLVVISCHCTAIKIIQVGSAPSSKIKN
jgi:hypothetical protein